MALLEKVDAEAMQGDGVKVDLNAALEATAEVATQVQAIHSKLDNLAADVLIIKTNTTPE